MDTIVGHRDVPVSQKYCDKKSILDYLIREFGSTFSLPIKISLRSTL